MQRKISRLEMTFETMHTVYGIKYDTCGGIMGQVDKVVKGGRHERGSIFKRIFRILWEKLEKIMVIYGRFVQR